VLQLNLPGLPSAETDDDEPAEAAVPAYFDLKKPFHVQLCSSDGRRREICMPGDATVGSLRAEARRLFRMFLGAREAKLIFKGRALMDNAAALTSLNAFHNKPTMLVVPMVRVEIPRPSSASASTMNSSSDDEDGSSGGELSDAISEALSDQDCKQQ